MNDRLRFISETTIIMPKGGRRSPRVVDDDDSLIFLIQQDIEGS
jgi:hypothetical protein